MSRKTQAAVYRLLQDDATLQQKVGTKIFPTFTPEDIKYPSIVYRITERSPVRSKDAIHGSDDRLQVMVFHKKSSEIQDIANAVYNVLEGYSGTTEGVKITRITYEGETDEPFAPELQLFILAQVYNIRVRY